MNCQPVRFVGGPLDGKTMDRPYGFLVEMALPQLVAYTLDIRAEDDHDGYLIFRAVK